MSEKTVAIEFKNVIKRFDGADYNAVDNVSFQVMEGELVTVLGTSGCGKTTLMKMVNRLYEPTSGSVEIFGKPIKDGDPISLRRNIGYVIQQVGLFPHMTVEKNIGIVPEILGWEASQISDRIDELLEMVNMDPAQFRQRYPSQLSGGQQQRVGLARALAVNPSIMLLDEPFGAIDAINRAKLQNELLRIHEQGKQTCIFVTHDVTEALKLGSRVMVMDGGRIRQFDSPKAIIRTPADDYVRSLIESATFGLEFMK